MKHVGITATIASDVWEKTSQYAGKFGLNKSQFINFALQYYLSCIDAGIIQPMLYASASLPSNPVTAANSYEGKTVAQIVAEQKKKARAAVMTPSEIAEMEEIERRGSFDPVIDKELEERNIALANMLN